MDGVGGKQQRLPAQVAAVPVSQLVVQNVGRLRLGIVLTGEKQFCPAQTRQHGTADAWADQKHRSTRFRSILAHTLIERSQNSAVPSTQTNFPTKSRLTDGTAFAALKAAASFDGSMPRLSSISSCEDSVSELARKPEGFSDPRRVSPPPAAPARKLLRQRPAADVQTCPAAPEQPADTTFFFKVPHSADSTAGSEEWRQRQPPVTCGKIQKEPLHFFSSQARYYGMSPTPYRISFLTFTGRRTYFCSLSSMKDSPCRL